MLKTLLHAKKDSRRRRLYIALKAIFSSAKSSPSIAAQEEPLWFNGAGNKPEMSKNQAKQRLQVLLVYDQLGLSTAQMSSMKSEIMDVIRGYLEVDEQETSFDLYSGADSVTLSAAVPIQRVLRQVR